VDPVPRESWFLYILRCADGTLYTGIARDVAVRVAMHEKGRGARYTRGRGPFELCVVRRCADQGRALRLEYAVKQLDREDKEALLTGRGLAAFARRALKR
jgi:predicted GIY-YIG superfamily endonuclease